MYTSHADLEGAHKMEKGNRAGSVQQVSEYALHPGCRRKKLLAYFGEKM